MLRQYQTLKAMSESKPTVPTLSQTLELVKNEESDSRIQPGYPEEVAKGKSTQPRPPLDIEYTVTDELRAALNKELDRLGRGGPVEICDRLEERLADRGVVYRPHPTTIGDIAKQLHPDPKKSGSRKSVLAFDLAAILKVPRPPVWGAGEDGVYWSQIQELRELHPELWVGIEEDLEKNLALARDLHERTRRSREKKGE